MASFAAYLAKPTSCEVRLDQFFKTMEHMSQARHTSEVQALALLAGFEDVLPGFACPMGLEGTRFPGVPTIITPLVRTGLDTNSNLELLFGPDWEPAVGHIQRETRPRAQTRSHRRRCLPRCSAGSGHWQRARRVPNAASATTRSRAQCRRCRTANTCSTTPASRRGEGGGAAACCEPGCWRDGSNRANLSEPPRPRDDVAPAPPHPLRSGCSAKARARSAAGRSLTLRRGRPAPRWPGCWRTCLDSPPNSTACGQRRRPL